jgi:hypothetical protein
MYSLVMGTIFKTTYTSAVYWKKPDVTGQSFFKLESTNIQYTYNKDYRLYLQDLLCPLLASGKTSRTEEQ